LLYLYRMEKCKKCGNNFQPQKGLKNYCSLSCRSSRTFTNETKKKKSIANKNQIPWNKGKIIGTQKEHVSKCLRCEKPIFHKTSRNRKYHKECWLLSSGGYREGATIKHKGEYNGVKMDSGSEKEFAMLCDSKNIKWKKNTSISFKYIGVDGKQHRYYPDFYLKDFNRWVEIKGKLYASKDENLQRKLDSVKDIILIYSKEIKKFDFGLLVK